MENSIHLIGWGRQRALPAEQVKLGDTLMWNYGHTSEVIGISRRKGSSLIEFTTRNREGNVCTRRLKATRLVAVA